MNNLISIIISTKNEEQVIENLLKSIKIQTYKPIEVIVVDNNSSDCTKEIAKKYTSLVFNKGPERSAQRNFGASKAKGKYILFLDADMVLDPRVVDECVKQVTNQKTKTFDPQIGGVIIPEKSIGKGYWGKVKAFERSFYIGDESIEAARFFNKEIFIKCGGYNIKITGPEDWDMSQRVRAKYKINRIRSFITHNERDAKLSDFIRKKYYYGKGSSSYLKSYPLKLTGKQVVYFFRPAIYRNWKRLLRRPDLTCGTIVLLAFEQAAGFLGFLKGQSRYSDENKSN